MSEDQNPAPSTQNLDDRARIILVLQQSGAKFLGIEGGLVYFHDADEHYKSTLVLPVIAVTPENIRQNILSKRAEFSHHPNPRGDTQ